MAEVPVTLLENIDRLTKYLEREVRLKSDMNQLLERIASAVGKQTGSVRTLEEATEELVETVKELNDEIVIESPLVQRGRELFSKATQIYHKSIVSLSNSFQTLRNITNSTLMNIEKGDFYFSKFFEQFKNVGGTIGTLATAASFVLRYVEQNIDLYRRLVMSGVQVEGGLISMQKMFKDLGLYTTDAMEALIANASLVNRLSMKNLSEFSTAVDENIEDLVSLGIPYNEIKKWSLTYLSVQRNLGKLRELTMKEQAESFDETLKQFYRAAQWMGISVAEFVEQYTRISKEPKTRVALQQLPEQSRTLINVLFQMLPTDITETVVDAIILGAIERTNNYVDLTVAGLTPFVQNLIQLITRPGTTVDDLVSYIKQFTVEDEKILRLYIAGFEKSAQMLNELSLAKRKLADRLTETLMYDQEQATATQKWMKNVTEMRIKIFDLQSKLLEQAENILTKYPQLGDAIVNALGTINDFMDSSLFKLIEFVMNVVSGVYNTIKHILHFIFSPLGIPDFITSLASGALTFGIGKALMRIIGKNLSQSAIVPAARTGLKTIFNLISLILRSKFGILAVAVGALGYAASKFMNVLENEESAEKSETVAPELEMMIKPASPPTPSSPVNPVTPPIPTTPMPPPLFPTKPLETPDVGELTKDLERYLSKKTDGDIPDYTKKLHQEIETFVKTTNQTIQKTNSAIEEIRNNNKILMDIIRNHLDQMFP